MNIGQKIQFYRNKLVLSTEELAQKINVSVETLELWEKGEASPTIDDLVVLKDVFSVSIDDLVSASEPQPVQEKPIESYEFRYTKDEIKALYGKVADSVKKRIIIFSVLVCALVAFAVLNYSLMAVFLAVVCVVVIVKNVKTYFKLQQNEKSSEERLVVSVYKYDTYYEYFKVHIEREDGSVEEHKIYYKEIVRVENVGEHLLLSTANTFFIIKKTEIYQNSGFYFISPKSKGSDTRQKPAGKLKVISIVLFVCSIASIYGALLGIAILSGMNHMFVETTWVFYLCTPIPIASIIFGIYLMKRGFKYKFNMIVGIVMVALLCLYGSFSFVFSGMYSHTDEVIVKAENAIGIDIPEHERINTQDWTQGTQSGMRGYVYYVSDIYFSDETVADFEKRLSSDQKWLSSVPSNMIGISSPYYDVDNYDYVIIYNVDTGELNKLPTNENSYRFINVMYNCEHNTMVIIEYEIEYKK